MNLFLPTLCLITSLLTGAARAESVSHYIYCDFNWMTVTIKPVSDFYDQKQAIVRIDHCSVTESTGVQKCEMNRTWLTDLNDTYANEKQGILVGDIYSDRGLYLSVANGSWMDGNGTIRTYIADYYRGSYDENYAKHCSILPVK